MRRKLESIYIRCSTHAKSSTQFRDPRTRQTRRESQREKGKKKIGRHFARNRKHRSSITLSFLQPITCKKASRFNELHVRGCDSSPRFFPERSSMYPVLPSLWLCGGNAREKQRIGRLEIYFPSWWWLDKTASLACTAQKSKYEYDVRINTRTHSGSALFIFAPCKVIL